MLFLGWTLEQWVKAAEWYEWKTGTRVDIHEALLEALSGLSTKRLQELRQEWRRCRIDRPLEVTLLEA